MIHKVKSYLLDFSIEHESKFLRYQLHSVKLVQLSDSINVKLRRLIKLNQKQFLIV